MDSLPDLLGKLDAAQRDATSAYNRVKPRQFFDHVQAELEAKYACEAQAKLEVNRQAASRGVSAVPYPPGLSGLWVTEHYSSYETALKKAVAEVGYHSRAPRPEGFWKRKETAAYDAKTAELQSDVAGWEKEIKWRESALKAASAALAHRAEAHVAALRAEYDRQQEPTAAKAAPLKARADAHARENVRLQDKIARAFSFAQRQKLDSRIHGNDRGR